MHVHFFRSGGTVGKPSADKYDKSPDENIAGGPSEAVPYTKLANAVCYLNSVSSNAEGTMIVKQQIGSPGHNIWLEMSNIPDSGGLHGFQYPSIL